MLAPLVVVYCREAAPALCCCSPAQQLLLHSHSPGCYLVESLCSPCVEAYRLTRRCYQSTCTAVFDRPGHMDY